MTGEEKFPEYGCLAGVLSMILVLALIFWGASALL